MFSFNKFNAARSNIHTAFSCISISRIFLLASLQIIFMKIASWDQNIFHVVPSLSAITISHDTSHTRVYVYKSFIKYILWLGKTNCSVSYNLITVSCHVSVISTIHHVQKKFFFLGELHRGKFCTYLLMMAFYTIWCELWGCHFFKLTFCQFESNEMPILDKIAFSNLSIMKIWYDDDNEMKEILGNQEKKLNYLLLLWTFFAPSTRTWTWNYFKHKYKYSNWWS